MRCGVVAGRGGTQRGSRAGGAGDVSTAGTSNASDEERSERTPSARLGLWKWSPSIRQQRFINDRLGLWKWSPSIRQQRFINDRLGLWKWSPSTYRRSLISERLGFYKSPPTRQQRFIRDQPSPRIRLPRQQPRIHSRQQPRIHSRQQRRSITYKRYHDRSSGRTLDIARRAADRRWVRCLPRLLGQYATAPCRSFARRSRVSVSSAAGRQSG